jgi:hypothetical protein
MILKNMKLQVEWELPVLPKQTSKKVNGSGTVLTPFPNKVIRLYENNKTDKNIMDTVKGCKGGCFGCYAESSMGVTFNAVKFDSPQSQILEPVKLQTDVLSHLERCSRRDTTDIPKEWVRNGVMGDPSYDWDLTVKAAETVSMAGSRMVIITKFWHTPSPSQLGRLALSGAILHWSVIAGYDWTREFDPNSRVPAIIDIIRRYKKMTPQESIFMRLCTFPWKKNQPIEEGMGDILWHGQEAFYNLTIKEGIRIIETPWQMRKSDPRMEHIDKEILIHPKSYKAKKYGLKDENGETKLKTGWVYGGPKYFDDKHALTESDAHVIGCVTDCGPCPNQCGSTSSASKQRTLHALMM